MSFCNALPCSHKIKEASKRRWGYCKKVVLRFDEFPREGYIFVRLDQAIIERKEG